MPGELRSHRKYLVALIYNINEAALWIMLLAAIIAWPFTIGFWVDGTRCILVWRGGVWRRLLFIGGYYYVEDLCRLLIRNALCRLAIREGRLLLANMASNPPGPLTRKQIVQLWVYKRLGVFLECRCKFGKFAGCHYFASYKMV